MKLLKTLLKLVAGALLLVVLAVAGMAFTLRATPPVSTFDLKPMAAVAPDPRPVLIFGASGKTGYEVVRLLRARGQPVTAAVRSSSDRSRLDPLGVSFVVADALDPAAVRAAAATGNFRAVITTVGCLRCDPPPDFIGNRNIIDATKASGAHRLILISTVGAGDSYAATNLLSRLVLSRILPLKTQAEDYLRASSLDYTIIRPGGLRPASKPQSGTGYLTEDRSALGFIHRADLARLIVAVLDDDRTIGRTFAAGDPAVNTPWQ